MTVNSLQDEDNLPIKEVIAAVDKNMVEVLRVVDAMNLGRTEVKVDGVYRTFNDGYSVKIAEGIFNGVKVPTKKIKLF